jgi:hypothetical protein
MPDRTRTRIFISFDYDNDLLLKNALVAQSRRKDSPFSIEDWSIKDASRAWRSEARRRMKQVDKVIVLCGYNTNRAVGITKEIEIARDVGTPYFLLRGHPEGIVRRPKGARLLETIHDWTWDNLRALTNRCL